MRTRVLPNEVLWAYRIHGLKPLREQSSIKTVTINWTTYRYICGIGALYYHETGKTDTKDIVESGYIDSLYRAGFEDGFDGRRNEYEHITGDGAERYKLGYQDGADTYTLVTNSSLS